MPNWKQFVRSRLPRLSVSATREAEIIEELAQLLEDRYLSARAEGCDEATATARAVARFPSGELLAQQILAAERPVTARLPEHVRPETLDERLRASRRGTMLQDFLQDVRGSFRLLQRNPGFSAIVVLTLALGIGANTAVFSVVNSIVLQPLRYPDGHELVRLFTTNPERGIDRINLSYPDLQDFAKNSNLLASVAAYSFTAVNFASNGEPERVDAARTTGNFFDVLKVRALQGRLITAADEASNAPVVVISERLWQRRFGGAQVSGQRVILNDQDYALIGVAPNLTDMPDLWLPLARTPATQQRFNRFLSVMGRLKTGVTAEQLRVELAGIARNLQTAYPETNGKVSIGVEPLKSVVVDEESRNIAGVLLAFVTLVLAIACANLANLLLSRSVAREREIAVRGALGATPRRLLRQLLTESAVLAGFGGVLGVAAGYAGMRVLLAVLPGGTPRVEEVRMDGWSLAYAAGISVLTGILFGLAPALQLARTSLLNSLRQGGHGVAGAGRGRLRAALLSVQIAVALTLLICAGLFGKSFYSMLQIRPGFNAENVLTFRLTLAGPRYSGAERASLACYEISQRLRAVPGVEQVSYSTRLPVEWGGVREAYMREGDAKPAPNRSPVAHFFAVSSSYLTTLQIPLVAGRGFAATDDADQPKTAVINQLLAQELWPGESAVGKRIRLHDAEDFPREIIGVIPSLRHNLEEPLEPQVLVPFRQGARTAVTLAVRTTGDPYLARRAVESAVRSFDANLPLFDVLSMVDRLHQQSSPQRFLAQVLGSLGVAALALAAVGIYGVGSYSVRQRTQEIGVRIALGAQRGQVVGLMLRQGLVPVGIGVAIGLAVGFAANHVLARSLEGFVTLDPLLVIGVAAAMTLVSALACFVPALRAARVDPLVALRYE